MASLGKCARGVLLVAVVVLWVGSAPAVGVPNLLAVEYVNKLKFNVLATITSSVLGEAPSTFVPEGKTVRTAVDPTVALTSAAFVFSLSPPSAPEIEMRYSTPGGAVSRAISTTGVQVTLAGSCDGDAGAGLLLLLRPMPLGVITAPDVLQQPVCARRVAR